MSVVLAQLKLTIKSQQQSNDYLVFSFLSKGLLPHKIIGESCSFIEKGKKAGVLIQENIRRSIISHIEINQIY